MAFFKYYIYDFIFLLTEELVWGALSTFQSLQCVKPFNDTNHLRLGYNYFSNYSDSDISCKCPIKKLAINQPCNTAHLIINQAVRFTL